MALIDWEDFDDCDPPNPPWQMSTGGRSSTVQITGSHTAVSFGYGLSPLRYILPAAKTTLIVGARGRVPALDRDLLHLNDGGTEQVTIRVTSTGAIRAYRGGSGGTLLGESSSGNYIQTNTTFAVEVKATVSDSAGVAVVRVNGVTALTLVSMDTKQSGAAQITDVYFGGGAALSPAYWDDIYLLDDTGAAPYNDFLGNPKCFYLPANAAGDSAQFTPSAGANYQCVDETGTPNDDTDYVSSSTAGHRDLYNAQNLSIAGGQVLAVVAVVRARKDDAATREIAVDLKAGSTVSVGPTQTLSTSYARYKGAVHTANPDTGAAWTVSQADAAQAGVEVIT
jgi:hypothetical protein